MNQICLDADVLYFSKSPLCQKKLVAFLDAHNYIITDFVRQKAKSGIKFCFS